MSKAVCQTGFLELELSRWAIFSAVLVAFVTATACESPERGSSAERGGKAPTESAKVANAPEVDEAAQPATGVDPPTGANRVKTVVIGDLHGDIGPLRSILSKTGLAAGDDWTGGSRTLIQTGDVLDRGDDEREIYELLWRLQEQAESAGGRVVLLNGNHEVMNVMGDLRYVTPGGAADFADYELPEDPRFAGVPDAMRGRLAAFLPGGEWAKRLADQPIIAKVDGRLYAHGGVHAAHVTHGIDAINAEMSTWMQEGGAPPKWATAQDGPLWTREWSGRDDPDCDKLRAMLDAAGATMLAVGHTPQRGGVVSRCDGKLWLVDTGMAEHYGGPTQALGIDDGGRVVVIH
jgi:hypothetical protein